MWRSSFERNEKCSSTNCPTWDSSARFLLNVLTSSFCSFAQILESNRAPAKILTWVPKADATAAQISKVMTIFLIGRKSEANGGRISRFKICARPEAYSARTGKEEEQEE